VRPPAPAPGTSDSFVSASTGAGYREQGPAKISVCRSRLSTKRRDTDGDASAMTCTTARLWLMSEKARARMPRSRRSIIRLKNLPA